MPPECDDDTPPRPYVTRKDQLNMKPEKARGRGKGRGRGRGMTGTAREGEETRRGTDRGRGRGRGKTKNSRSGQSAHGEPQDQDWWDETWEAGWGHPDEEWATDGWGDSGYRWDSYAWWEGKGALEELADTSDAKTKKRKSPAAKEADPSHEAAPTTKGKDVKRPTSSSSGKKPPKKSKHPEAEETAEPAASKTAAKRTNKKKLEHADVADEGGGKKAKKKKQNKTPEAEEMPDAEEHEETEQVPVPTDFIKKIKKYYKLFCQMEETEATQEIKDEMKSRLNGGPLLECRLNSYWKLATCGVTSRSKKKDIAHFNFNDIEGISYMCALSLCIKCAELFVARVHKVICVVPTWMSEITHAVNIYYIYYCKLQDYFKRVSTYIFKQVNQVHLCWPPCSTIVCHSLSSA